MTEIHVRVCDQCGARWRTSDPNRPCRRCKVLTLMPHVPQDVWREIDEQLREGQLDSASWLLANYAREKPELGIKLSNLAGMVRERCRQIGVEPVQRHPTPDDYRDTVSNFAAEPGGDVVAIQALWDGDTRGWFIVLGSDV